MTRLVAIALLAGFAIGCGTSETQSANPVTPSTSSTDGSEPMKPSGAAGAPAPAPAGAPIGAPEGAGGDGTLPEDRL